MHKERITVPGTTSVCPIGCAIKREYKDYGGYQILQARCKALICHPFTFFIEINPFVITNEGFFFSFPYADEQCMGAFHLVGREEPMTRSSRSRLWATTSN